MLYALNQQKYNNGLMLVANPNLCPMHAIPAQSKRLVIRHLATNKLWSARKQQNCTSVFTHSIRLRSGSSISASQLRAIDALRALFYTVSCITSCKATGIRFGCGNSHQHHPILEENSPPFRWKSHCKRN